MKTTIRTILALSLLASCSESKDKDAPTESTDNADKPLTGTKTPGADSKTIAKDTTTGQNSNSKEKTIFSYPPAGDGPHTGFDLEAIRGKLQGTWLVGGTAFSSIPKIWHVSGDSVTQVDTAGKKSEHTLQLLAPCYAKMSDIGTSSATYVHFVFDGETLYQGLGNSGVVAGDTSVGCMSAAVYVHKGDKCTSWKQKSFPRKGEAMFESEPGECGYEGEGDDKLFFGDDTNSKRKIYGKQKLPVRMGDALMTKQMSGNKAEKVESLDVAIAKQKVLIDAKEALTKPPEELAYSGWGLPKVEVVMADKQRLWAAGIDRDGKWRLASFRYKSTHEDTFWLRGMSDRFAPSAFVQPSKSKTSDFKKGQLVVYASGIMLWGIVDSVDAEKVTISYLSGNKVSQKSEKPEMFIAFDSGKFTLGAPIRWQEGEAWFIGWVAYDAGDSVYVLHGSDMSVSPIAKAALELTVPKKAFKKGAKISVREKSAIGGTKWVPAKVTKVLNKGVAYEVKTDEGKIFTQSWAFVTKG